MRPAPTPRHVPARVLLLTALLVGLWLAIASAAHAEIGPQGAVASATSTNSSPRSIRTIPPAVATPAPTPPPVRAVPLSPRIAGALAASWYRYQGAADSGDCPRSNCGPAAVAMAIGYAKGRWISVEDIRTFTSKQSCRGTDYSDIYRALKNWKVEHKTITGMKALKEAINTREHAVVVLAYMGYFRKGADYLKPASDPAQHFDRYHAYTSGHVIIVRGITDDGAWVIVEDPYVFDGSGWGFYKGGTPKGLNRYYRYAEFVEAYGYYGYQGVEIFPK